MMMKKMRYRHWNFELQNAQKNYYMVENGILTGVREEYKSKLKTAFIPRGVKAIAKGAMRDMQALEKVSLPDSVKIIDDEAFFGCKKLCCVKFSKNLKRIGRRTFFGCESLGTVAIFSHRNLVIDEFAFAWCKKMRTVIIDLQKKGLLDAKVKKLFVSEAVFYKCESLKFACIGDVYGKLGDRAFLGCTTLEKLCISGVIDQIGDAAFLGCKKLSEFSICDTSERDDTVSVISDAVKKIGRQAFCECTSLAGINMGNGVETLGKGVFYNCENLSFVKLSQKLEEIPARAFYGCKNLESILLPNSVKKICDYAFADCPKLETVCIDSHMTDVSKLTFGINGKCVFQRVDT